MLRQRWRSLPHRLKPSAISPASPSISIPARCKAGPARCSTVPVGRSRNACASTELARSSTRNISSFRATMPSWRARAEASSVSIRSGGMAATTVSAKAAIKEVIRTATKGGSQGYYDQYGRFVVPSGRRPNSSRGWRRRNATSMAGNTRRHASIRSVFGAIGGEFTEVLYISSDLRRFAPFAGVLAGTARAQTKSPEFKLEEGTTTAALSVEQLKPKIILFMDRPSEELIDPDAGPYSL